MSLFSLVKEMHSNKHLPQLSSCLYLSKTTGACAFAVLIVPMFCHVIYGLFDDTAASQAIYRLSSVRATST
jgi:hypothetical protein